ncbi:hypothetical protein KVT40_000281 [Elsinoe batatas]|uniref:Uncharacterized protein n=1 Tax=Elsinoe batatas TaxID=2601811 RepID=A0A8K0PIH4_9PEZI|nr:hypothetical protein KVT40_000281 [Elsinoe batatas]
MEVRLPSLPWDVLFMIIDEIRCQHCQSVLSRACKPFRSRLIPRVWETLHIVELCGNGSSGQTNANRRCYAGHGSDLPLSTMVRHANSEPPCLPDRLYQCGPRTVFPHLFGVLSTLFRKPYLRQHVKHLRVRRTYWEGELPYNAEKQGATALHLIAGGDADLASGVREVVRNAAGSSQNVDKWTMEFSGPNFGNAYLAVLLSLLSESLQTLDVLEGGARDVDSQCDAARLAFGWLSYQTSPQLQAGETTTSHPRFSGLERMTVRYYPDHYFLQISKPQEPFEFISRSDNVRNLTIQGGSFQPPLQSFDFGPCPALRRLELDSCVFMEDFSDLELILNRLSLIDTLCIILDRLNYHDIRCTPDGCSIELPSKLLLDVLMDVLAVGANTYQNLTIGLTKPDDFPWFPVDESASQSLKDFTKLKRLHIDDGLYSACNSDDFDFECQLTNALPPQLEELRLIIDSEFSSMPHETMIHLLNHKKSQVPGLQRLIVDADWKWLRKNTKAVLELEELCEDEDVECIVLRNGVQGSYVPPGAPLEDLQPWQRTAARTRKDWRDLLVM